MNVSVWESVEALKNYVYGTVHAQLLRQRHEWFEKFAGVYLALWWVPAGHRPGIEEAKERLGPPGGERPDAVRVYVQDGLSTRRAISGCDRLGIV